MCDFIIFIGFQILASVLKNPNLRLSSSILKRQIMPCLEAQFW
jgi:hypothetical protein